MLKSERENTTIITAPNHLFQPSKEIKSPPDVLVVFLTASEV